jgi:cyanophycin synthetase
LLDAVLRRPPAVVGDGRSTIRRLVEMANAERLAACKRRVFKLLTIDQDMRHTLAAQGLTLHGVPPAGQSVTLKTVVNQNFGPENVTATESVCDAVIEAGARAASCVGARFAGVDVVTPDASVPLEQAGGVVLEVNVAPGFQYHYHKKDGNYPVAVRVLERMLNAKRASVAAVSAAPSSLHVAHG